MSALPFSLNELLILGIILLLLLGLLAAAAFLGYLLYRLVRRRTPTPAPAASLPPAPASPAPSPAGAGDLLLNRYRVVRTLGRGAMGEVIEVEDRQSSLRYALKRLPPEVVADAMALAAVRSNFTLVSRLTHPHIATTRYLETESTGAIYIIMDLVQGATLGEWLVRERNRRHDPEAPLPPPVALGIAEQMAAALDYAHRLPVETGAGGSSRVGILHRDLKPSNVMLEAGREFRAGVPFVRLVDFGIAAEVQASLQGLSLAAAENPLAGTPAYMAPEQWEGRTLTPGVDQWALAVIVSELLSGRRIFQAPTLPALAETIRRAEPEKPEAIPAPLWGVLRRALARDRRDRYPSCGEFVEALQIAALPSTNG